MKYDEHLKIALVVAEIDLFFNICAQVGKTRTWGKPKTGKVRIKRDLVGKTRTYLTHFNLPTDSFSELWLIPSH